MIPPMSTPNANPNHGAALQTITVQTRKSSVSGSGSPTGTISVGSQGVKAPPGYVYSVWVSFMEIYNENIFDLLIDTPGIFAPRRRLDVRNFKDVIAFGDGYVPAIHSSEPSGTNFVSTATDRYGSRATP